MVEINYEQQLVRSRTPSRGELVITGERASPGPALCSSARDRRLIQWGYSGFLDDVSNSRVETMT